MLWMRTKLGGGEGREALLSSPPGSQTSAAFVSQIILSVRRQIFLWHRHAPGCLPAEAQHCAELRWCSESCPNAGLRRQRPTRARGEGCAGGKWCGWLCGCNTGELLVWGFSSDYWLLELNPPTIRVLGSVPTIQTSCGGRIYFCCSVFLTSFSSFQTRSRQT